MPRTVTTIASGMNFLEGPRWHDGTLYASDMFAKHVLRFAKDGTVETVCDVPGQPSGLGWDATGHLLISSMTDRRVLRHANGRLDVVAALEAEAPGPLNDMIVDRHGGLYIGNFGSHLDDGEPLRRTHLLRVAPDGRVSRVAEGLVFPNGMAITPDGGTLLVAETYAFRISAFGINPDGSLTGRRDWANLGPAPDPTQAPEATIQADHPLPDGICLDSEGCLWVADVGGDGALRVTEGGKIVDKVETPGLAVYAVVLGGPDLTTLYMCAAPKLGTSDPKVERRGCLLSCQVDVPGLP
ncbi:SMP-30/gluconolactonase/LRE family protein [Streptomyces sp. NPDC005356]|uniref:SMP-30/gluconolactonase/LRE family protein n=1 Tax=Streptomyces sp. NPDC005356 TaxID=3157167 RepID=UPI0033A24B07